MKYLNRSEKVKQYGENNEVLNSFFNVIRIAMLGSIYPSIRGIAFQYKIISNDDYLKLIYYYDREVTAFDKELAECTAVQIDSMLGITGGFEIEHIFSNENSNKLEYLDGWLYFRYEDEKNRI